MLAQQQHLLSRSNLPDAEKQTRIDLQKRINEAAMTGKGLEALPPDIRRQIDNAEFQSLLNTDPAKIVPARSPADSDRPGRARHAGGRPPTPTASKRSRATGKPPAAVDVVKVPGVNHLLAPATTGEVDEYATLPDKHVSPAVSAAVVEWLKKTLK